MKLGTRLCGAALSLLLLSTAFWTVAEEAGGARANEEEQLYFVTPQVSDGIVYDADCLNNLAVEGKLEGDTFTFSKDAVLQFTIQMQDGWRFCEDFSILFPNDRAHLTLQSDAGAVTISYQAVKGRSVPFDDLEGVFLNATPEKLPRLDITVEGGFDQINKQDWIPAHYKLANGSKQYASADYEGDGEIKGRGNTSWGFAQKPYSIKLGAKASLLDIPKTKKYAIVSPEADPSLLRNYITYKAGLELAGIGYTPKVEQVEVWLNGGYNGVYALVERIDIESTKIDIPEAVDGEVITNLTGGYIIEKDAGDKVDKNVDPWFDCPYQANPNGDLFTLKAPDLPTDKSEAQKALDYLTAYMKKVDGAIMGTSGEDYKKYVDIDSWVDFVIIQEIAKNIDGNLKTSCYMYKEPDNDTLYMTAPWDFDNAYGAADWDNKAPGKNDVDDCPNGTGTEEFMVINSSCPWYKKLYSIPEFKQALKERYTQYRTGLIENLLLRIDTGAAYLKTAAASQNDKWGRLGNYADRVSTLRSWLQGRLAWLDSQWLLDTPETHMVTVTVEGQGVVARLKGDGPVQGRQTAVYTVQPAKGYQLASVAFNGIDLTQWVAGNTFTTPILTNNAVLTVAFEKEPPVLHTITLTEEGRGSVALSKTEACAGDEVGFTVAAGEGYLLKSLTITGKITGQSVDYSPAADGGSFIMPDEDIEIVALFEKIPAAVPGDLDKNGEVTIQDVMEACKVLARQSAGKAPTADEMVWGDLDGDGAFTIGDVMEICKILARKT